MSDLRPVTDSEFQTAVLDAAGPVLVDFWAEWCRPCRQVTPILEEIAAAHGGKMAFFKLNVDENPETRAAYRVTGIPMMNVYVGGEVAKSIVGAKPKVELLAELADFLES